MTDHLPHSHSRVFAFFKIYVIYKGPTANDQMTSLPFNAGQTNLLFIIPALDLKTQLQRARLEMKITKLPL